MPDKMGEKELEQIMEKLFTIAPQDYRFFQRTLTEIAKIDEGANLLRSLSTNFEGKKFTLITTTDPKNRGYISDSDHEICIRKQDILNDFISQNLSLGETENYPKALFHEMTHWEQWQNEAGKENAITEEDKFFTTLMAEADAQASGDLFEVEQNKNTGFQFTSLFFAPKLLRFVKDKLLNPNKRFTDRTKKELKNNHPDWSEEKIKKETRKSFFKKILLNKEAYWRKVYEDPEIVESTSTNVKNQPYSQKEFPDIMKYYMEKWGLTLEECQELKKEILEQSYKKYIEKKAPLNNRGKTDDPPHTPPTPHLIQTVTKGVLSQEQPQKIFTKASSSSQKTKHSELSPAILSHFGKDGQGE